MTLSWFPATGATSYNLYWSTTSGVTKTNGTRIAGVSSSYIQGGLTNGVPYYYIVTAVNSAGESVPSSQVSATPSAATTPGYTIGGDVVGLASGQSVVLQDNGGDNLTVGANGAFTFATALAFNATYNVTVLTQPANGQTCQVATAYVFGSNSGSGTVGTSNVDTVRVSCYAVNTFAGSGQLGQGDAVAEEAAFNGPSGMTMDSVGNIYVAEAGSAVAATNSGFTNVIRKITPSGVTTTLAGSIRTGYVDSSGSNAQFNFYGITNNNAVGMPGLAVDSAGNVYVADVGNSVVRKITPAGVVTTLAGSGVAGYADGTGAAAQFNFLSGSAAFGYTAAAGLAVDSSGNVYVGDSGNNRIRKITPLGVVSTLAGSTLGYANGTGAAAQFYTPVGVAVDGSGNVYVADYGNCTIRKITPAGVVSTYAGAGMGSAGYTDATGAAAMFWYPQGVTLDASGNLYVTDNSKVIRVISPTGVVSTIAGSWSTGYADGPAISAKFSQIQGIAVDASGNVFVADRAANKIFKASIKPYSYTVGGHVVGLVAGHSLVLQNNGADNLTVSANGLFTFATPLTSISGAPSYNVTILTQPAGQTCTLANNTGGFTTGDVLSVNVNCAAVSTFAGSGAVGSANGTGTAASFNFPAGSGATSISYAGAATDSVGNIYLADTGNDVIRKITPAGVVSTYAGMAGSPGLLNTASAITSKFTAPQGVAVDSTGNVYVADTGNGVIRKIAPNGGAVTTLAGQGGLMYADGTGTAAGFCFPTGIALDSTGNLYVADGCNDAIRKVTPAGVVTTLAGGTGTSSNGMGYLNGPGNVAKFNSPTDVAVDASGNVYVTDTKNYAIRKVTPAGQVTTFVGLGEMGGYAGYATGTGVDIPFQGPTGITIDGAGNFFVTDYWNNVVLMISPMGVILTLAGPTTPTGPTMLSASAGYADGSGVAARFSAPGGVTVDASGNVYVVDGNNLRIRKIVQ